MYVYIYIFLKNSKKIYHNSEGAEKNEDLAKENLRRASDAQSCLAVYAVCI